MQIANEKALPKSGELAAKQQPMVHMFRQRIAAVEIAGVFQFEED